jgi:hypothetical protein
LVTSKQSPCRSCRAGRGRVRDFFFNFTLVNTEIFIPQFAHRPREVVAGQNMMVAKHRREGNERQPSDGY